jgi:hypothetical protein
VINSLTLSPYTEAPAILSGPNDVTVGLREDSEDQLPSFTCVAAGIPAPTVQWIYIPNLDGRGDEISLSDGENYRVMSNFTARDDGRQQIWTSVTFLELTVTDGGLVRCRTSSPTTAAISADALLTIIGTYLIPLLCFAAHLEHLTKRKRTDHYTY